MKFLDQVRIYLLSGTGGRGACSFRKEKFIEFGGPNGGNGGKGADIWIEAVGGLNTLIDFRYTQHFKADNGQRGMGQDRNGANAKPLVIKVPIGTQVFDEAQENLLCDLTEEGQRFLIAYGGDGGHGNAHFKTSTNRAPRRADAGIPGEELWIWLRLKLIADVGLVGLPNAGKSTFLAASTRATPKIGAYPFTTLHPNLGVVDRGFERFVLADIPGLIEGASEGVGLGTRFLGHIERTASLIHLIDVTSDDPLEEYRIVRKELEAYGADLNDRDTVVALNKIDTLPLELCEEIAETLSKEIGCPVLLVSGVSGAGVDTLLQAAFETVKKRRMAEEKVKEAKEIEEKPKEEKGWSPV